MHQQDATVDVVPTATARKLGLVVAALLMFAGGVALSLALPQGAVGGEPAFVSALPDLVDRVEIRREMLRRRLADRAAPVPRRHEARPSLPAGTLTSPADSELAGVDHTPPVGPAGGPR